MAKEMDCEDWLTLLGMLWSGFDNIGHCGYDLYWEINDKARNMRTMIPEMMSLEERVPLMRCLNNLLSIEAVGQETHSASHGV